MKRILNIFAFIFLLAYLPSYGQYVKLYDFEGGINGGNPYGSLTLDKIYMYGTTLWGGTYNNGTIFKIKSDGSGYIKLFDFNDTISGNRTYGSLTYDGTNLYGMTYYGGTNDNGTIFKINTDGTGYVKLFDFNIATTGSNPRVSLIYDSTLLYGTTNYGDTNGSGTIFKIKTDGSGYTKLLDFADSANGSYPYGDLLFDGTFLYGTTAAGGTNYEGTIFKIKKDGSGYTKLLDCTSQNGNFPYGSLISDGVFLYGMTGTGGTNDFGTIFKIKPDGTGFVKLFDFDSINGRQPMGSLILQGDYLYGMTSFGGINDLGTVFKIKPDGTEFTKLVDFVGITNGSNPMSSLISDGNFLYGMTSYGGANTTDGVIFKLNIQNTGGVETNITSTSAFAFYPNPAKDNLTIETNTNTEQRLEIINLMGQTVYTSIINKKAIVNTSAFPSGIYILKLYTDKEIVVRKFVKE